ncbi:hypothetical protein ACSPAB_23215 [Buttiauxella agrestis]
MQSNGSHKDSHSKGFDNAEDILSKIDLNYRNLVKSIGQLHEALEFLSAIKSGIAQADVALLEKYENLAKEHTNNISAIDAIVEQLDVIERWSIIVLDRDVILKVTKLMREANVSSANAYNSSRGCIYDINYMSMDEFDINHKSFKTYYNEFLKDFAQSEILYNKFKTTEFTKIFKVK